jgi:hypothetical protein
MGGLLLVLAASCSFDKTDPRVSGGSNDGGEYYDRPAESFVANPFCRACHLDFDEEELALDHELAGIGCERCHGESQRHRSDEENVTPPEIMYPKERINPTCMMCHPRHEIEHVQDHQALLAGAETIFDETAEDAASAEDENKYCTDCHGQDHRMKVRTVRWNKATGELIETQ